MTAPSPMPTHPLGITSLCGWPCQAWCVTWRGMCLHSFDTVQQARQWIDQHKERT